MRWLVALSNACALALAAAGCGGAKPAGPPPSFADLEICIDALEQIAATPVEKRIHADLTSCGGGRIDSGRDALVRAAEWLARRRADAKAAERKDLLAEIDRVASAVLPVALQASGEGYRLPESRASGQPVAPLCSYTAVKADSVRREACGLVQLQPHLTPPLARLEGARSKVIAYPILLVADAEVPAARVLEVVMEHEDGSVLIAVQGSGGAVFQHPVELRGAVNVPVAKISIGAKDDRPAIERSLDAVRGKAEALVVSVADGVSTQVLVDALDAAGRAGFTVVTGPEPEGHGYGPGIRSSTTPGTTVVRLGQVTGTMPYEPVVAMRYVRRHMPAIRSCFEPVKNKDRKKKPPPVLGSFDTDLAIDASGKVTSASIAKLPDRRIKSCTLAVLERIVFLEAKSGGTIHFPLVVEVAR